MSKSWGRSRREEILKKWPLHAQAAARMDADIGNTAALNKMHIDIAAIKKVYPKPAVKP